MGATGETTWSKVEAAANELRDHWNKVKATHGNPGDGLIGNMIGALLEAIEAHALVAQMIDREPTAERVIECPRCQAPIKVHESPSPLAALDAAERALLVAGGWTEADGEWRCSREPWKPVPWSREDALRIARRELTARGAR